MDLSYIKRKLEEASQVTVDDAKRYMAQNDYGITPFQMELDDLIQYLAREYDIYVSIPEAHTVIILGDVGLKVMGKHVDPLSFLRGFFLGKEVERERARWDYDTREWDL